MRGALRIAAWGLIGLIAAAGNAAADEGRRVALVIGNSSYPQAPLKNPVNDARAVTKALRDQGFEVILKENAGKQPLESAVADFGEKLNEGATGLFYYAGHGMQVNGRNYLIPVDAQIRTENRVRIEAVDVDLVLEQMQAARTRMSLVILDACRNNPFERRFRGFGGGLAQINAPEGTLIAYATSPGKVAADGDSANGLYTQEFLKAVKTPGLKVEDVFKTVRVNVSRASEGTQVPWEASSLTGDFYFNAALQPPAPSMEQLFWEAVKNSDDPTELQFYLRQFPTGAHAQQVRDALAALKPATITASVAAVPPTRSEPPVAAKVSVLSPSAAAPTAPGPTALAPSAPAVASLTKGDLGQFNGRYSATLRDTAAAQGYDLNALIEVDGGKITGFSTAGRDVRICRVSGSIDDNGVVQSFVVRCVEEGAATTPVIVRQEIFVTLSGRFERNAAGDITGQTDFRANTGKTGSVTWRRQVGS